MTDTATAYLSTAQYREANGLAERTLKRYLADGKIPGAEKDAEGRWRIPADAIPPTPGPAPFNVDRDAAAEARAIVVAQNAARRELEAQPALADVLARRPAFVTLEEAARLLGVPEFVIRRDPQTFDALVYGGKGHRTILVPQATIRRVAGI